MIFGFFVGALGLLRAPQRMWPNYLIAVVYATGLGLGAGFFIATQYVYHGHARRISRFASLWNLGGRHVRGLPIVVLLGDLPRAGGTKSGPDQGSVSRRVLGAHFRIKRALGGKSGPPSSGFSSGAVTKGPLEKLFELFSCVPQFR